MNTNATAPAQQADATDADEDSRASAPPPNGVQAKVRSETPYPYFGLTKVMEIVQAVQRAGGNGPAPAADVLREMKVTKTDRSWAYGIPAAIMFDVVERVGRGDDAKLKLTDLGLRLALPGTPDEQRATKVAAFRSPELYGKLMEKFANHPVPSKEALRNILQRDFKIVESMAGNAAEGFLDSLKVAELITSGGTIGQERPAPNEEKNEKPVGDLSDAAKGGMQTIHVPADFVIYKCKIGKGRVLDIPLPAEFSKSDVARLYAFLQTQVDDDEGQ